MPAIGGAERLAQEIDEISEVAEAGFPMGMKF